jgi:hypothetical protein
MSFCDNVGIRICYESGWSPNDEQVSRCFIRECERNNFLPLQGEVSRRSVIGILDGEHFPRRVASAVRAQRRRRLIDQSVGQPTHKSNRGSSSGEAVGLASCSIRSVSPMTRSINPTIKQHDFQMCPKPGHKIILHWEKQYL